MIDRRRFANALALTLLGVPIVAVTETAQRLPVVGVLTTNPDVRVWSSGLMVQGLRELGYVEGKNFTLEIRSAAGKPTSLPGLAGELVTRNVEGAPHRSAVGCDHRVGATGRRAGGRAGFRHRDAGYGGARRR